MLFSGILVKENLTLVCLFVFLLVWCVVFSTGIKNKLATGQVASGTAASEQVPIAGVTSWGKYSCNYRSVYELMTHADDILPEDMRQYEKVCSAGVTL